MTLTLHQILTILMVRLLIAFERVESKLFWVRRIAMRAQSMGGVPVLPESLAQ